MTTTYPRLPIDITIAKKATKRGGWKRYAITQSRQTEVIGYLEAYGTGSSKHWDISRLHPCYDLEADLHMGMTVAEAKKTVQGYLC